MYKTLLLGLALLLLAAGLQAQDNMSKSSSAPTSMTGCLSTETNRYFLTDSSGERHRLTGAAQKLKNYVGRQIEVTGKPGVLTKDATVQGAASSVTEKPVFHVTSVKQIADTCSAK